MHIPLAILTNRHPPTISGTLWLRAIAAVLWPAITASQSTSQAYCVSVSGAGNPGVTTTSIPSATAAPTPPAPTYTGQPSDCNKWDVVESGDSCRHTASADLVRCR
ncbi:hypothetical protein CGGC5_v017376 [Colletotrichum fructicola Nara gc5]|uniref:Uncharacterized protein n=1 Tax=Colletotrichum fructicola (strain Nara gc5) TaxID=1213859 RepID=A0A7J6IDD2_COLFN|nr:hypothetical protein CGGC5_v017376 [Colletotrichum fructicola Nara gc5]